MVRAQIIGVYANWLGIMKQRSEDKAAYNYDGYQITALNIYVSKPMNEHSVGYSSKKNNAPKQL